MRSNKGVSIIELVIVMIILILIAGFAVYNGAESVEKAEATEIYIEISNMHKAVSGVIVQKDMEEGDAEWLKSYYDKDLGNNWYEIYGQGMSGEYLSSNVRKNLKMDTIKRNYIVNYDTGEVMLSSPVSLFGSSVRTYDSIRALVESSKI